MVKTLQVPVRVYEHPFELIARAYDLRFPTSHLMPLVIETEILDEISDEDTGEKTIIRQAKTVIDAPYLIKKLIVKYNDGNDYLLLKQKNVLDRRNRTLTTEAWNESFPGQLDFHENCKYFVHPENPEWTCLEKTFKLEVKNLYKIEGIVEKIAFLKYQATNNESKNIIEYHIKELEKQGITHIPIWTQTERTEDEGNKEGVENLLSNLSLKEQINNDTEKYTLNRQEDDDIFHNKMEKQLEHQLDETSNQIGCETGKRCC